MRVAIYLVVVFVLAFFIKSYNETTYQLEQLRAENKELTESAQMDWSYIQSLQDRLLELNRISEQLETERDAITERYNSLRKQTKQELVLAPCAGVSLPDNVVNILQQFGSNADSEDISSITIHSDQ